MTTTEILLSILIPTLESRRRAYESLRTALDRQIEKENAGDLVEILTQRDRGNDSIGAKRNRLIEKATGRFVVFIDDDDTVAEDYVRRIIDVIRENSSADCICFTGEVRFRGRQPRNMRHSIAYKDWQFRDGDYVRPPCHITPIRRDIARRYRFVEKNHAEDMDWTMRICCDGALRSEAVLDETLYFYDSRRPWAVQWLLDRSQPLRHRVGLRFVSNRNGLRRDGQKPELLFVANNFLAYGGGNCVVAWSLMALREHWNVTLFTPQVPDFDTINKHFGTRLARDDFRIKKLPFPLNRINRLDPDPFSIQQLAWMMRTCRRISGEYDAVMSCDDEIDFGRAGIQYTHYPHMQRHFDAIESVQDLSKRQRLWRFIKGGMRPWLFISGISLHSIRRNLMVTNSNWTADVLREIYGVEPRVVYPPVRWDGPDRPLEQRKYAFVCLGRLSPVKRYLEMIGIIEQVRARGFDVTLEIIGDKDAIAGDEYVRAIEQRMAAAGDWVRLHQGISRRELEELVSRCRYGLHGMLDEHFGIAPAELIRGGCVVFVHNDGGQVEIVGENPELRYDSDEDAVEKICQVLADPETEKRLRQTLKARSVLFTESEFMKNIQATVTGFARNNR